MLQQKNHQVITNQSTILQTLLQNGNHLSTIVTFYFQWLWLLQCLSSYLLFFFTLSYLRSDGWFLIYDWQYYLCLHSPVITYFVTTCKSTVISSYFAIPTHIVNFWTFFFFLSFTNVGAVVLILPKHWYLSSTSD